MSKYRSGLSSVVDSKGHTHPASYEPVYLTQFASYHVAIARLHGASASSADVAVECKLSNHQLPSHLFDIRFSGHGSINGKGAFSFNGEEKDGALATLGHYSGGVALPSVSFTVVNGPSESSNTHINIGAKTPNPFIRLLTWTTNTAASSLIHKAEEDAAHAGETISSGLQNVCMGGAGKYLNSDFGEETIMRVGSPGPRVKVNIGPH